MVGEWPCQCSFSDSTNIYQAAIMYFIKSKMPWIVRGTITLSLKKKNTVKLWHSMISKTQSDFKVT